MAFIALMTLVAPDAGSAQAPGRQSDWTAPGALPEHWRRCFDEMRKVEREVQNLRPLFPHWAMAVLQDIKELERRPATRSTECGEAYRMGFFQVQAAPKAPPQWDNLSADERDVRSGSVQRRLVNLLETGRITQAEFDGLAKRLRGD